MKYPLSRPIPYLHPGASIVQNDGAVVRSIENGVTLSPGVELEAAVATANVVLKQKLWSISVSNGF